mmetsp:Transcript_115289/g.337065  ORF Transcript_115289/g.337065 Transcript_115289/m.337065 type:complete len:226 (+) Transcript_115289:1025-1702(+)
MASIRGIQPINLVIPDCWAHIVNHGSQQDPLGHMDGVTVSVRPAVWGKRNLEELLAGLHVKGVDEGHQTWNGRDARRRYKEFAIGQEGRRLNGPLLHRSAPRPVHLPIRAEFSDPAMGGRDIYVLLVVDDGSVADKLVLVVAPGPGWLPGPVNVQFIRHRPVADVCAAMLRPVVALSTLRPIECEGWLCHSQQREQEERQTEHGTTSCPWKTGPAKAGWGMSSCA